MIKHLMKLGNSYGAVLINFLLVLVYFISFGIESYRKFNKEDVIITTELKNEDFINPPGSY